MLHENPTKHTLAAAINYRYYYCSQSTLQAIVGVYSLELSYNGLICLANQSGSTGATEYECKPWVNTGSLSSVWLKDHEDRGADNYFANRLYTQKFLKQGTRNLLL